MPPITDPLLLQQIQQQQMQGPGIAPASPPPDPYYSPAPQPFPGARTVPFTPIDRGAAPAKTRAEIPFVAPKAKADTAKTEAEIPQVQAQTEKTQGDIEEQRQKRLLFDKARIAAMGYTEDSIKNIAEARSIITANPNWAAKWGALLAPVPGSQANALKNALAPVLSNTAFERLQNTRALSPTGGSATGQTSDFEQQMLMNSVAGIKDQTQDPAKLLKHLDLVETHFYRALASSENKPLPNTLEEGRQMYPELANEFKPPEAKAVKAPEDTSMPGGDLSVTHEVKEVPPAYQAEDTAWLKANQGHITGKSYFAHRRELDEKYKDEVGGSFTHWDAKAFNDFAASANKGARISKIPPIVKEKPIMSVVAGMASAANAAAGGIPEATTGPEGREYFEGLTKAHPATGWAGELAGSLFGLKGVEAGGKAATKKLIDLATEKGLIKGGSRAATKEALKDAAVNAVYGGSRGYSGSEEGQGGEGFAKGLAIGAAASVPGTFVARGVTPLKSAEFQAAREAVPTNSLKSFNRAVGQRAVDPIGVKIPTNIKPGAETNDFVYSTLSGEYNRIKPLIKGSTDQQFKNEVTALRTTAKTPAEKDALKKLDEAIGFFRDPKTGAYTGEGYVKASDRLRDLSRRWRNDTQIGDMADVADKMRQKMQFVIQRQAPPKVAGALKNVERGWARWSRISEAAQTASTRAGNEDVLLTPQDYLKASKKLSPSKHAVARGKAFEQPYAAAASKVIGSSGAPKVGLREGSRFASILVGAGTVGFAPHETPFIIPAIGAIAYGAYGPEAKLIANRILTGKRPSLLEAQKVRYAIDDYIRHQTTGK